MGGDLRLALGGVAAALVLLCASRALRRWLWRLAFGAAAARLRAHLWLGGLSLVLALLHGGFRLGGPLSAALLLLLMVTVLSGALGAALQRLLPRRIHALSVDTVFDLQRGALSLRRRAYEALWAACGAPPDADEGQELRRLLGRPPRAPTAPQAQGALAGQEVLLGCYRERVLPFLRGAGRGASALANAAEAALSFDAVAAQLEPPLHPALGELRDVCAQLRAARRQHQLHRWLHGWLLLHGPLSVALLVLLLAHAVLALRY